MGVGAATTLALVMGLAALPPVVAQPIARLQPETIRAFEGYVASLERQLQQAREDRDLDWLAQGERRVRLHSGEILIERLSRAPEIPGGMIHEWMGGMFIKHVTAQAVLDLLTDYNRHSQVYSDVETSTLLARDGDTIRSFLRLKKKKVLTVVLNTEHEAKIIRGLDDHLYLLSNSKRIAEVKNAGGADERELPVGEDSGFVWRLNAYWSLEQAADGVFVSCLSVTLSRDIPWGLRWVIRPFVEGTPREALERMLRSTCVALSR